MPKACCENRENRQETEMTSLELYAYLRTQFTTLDEALAWAATYNRERPPLPEEFGSISTRGMAYHMSMVLEGHIEDPDDGPLTNYMDTRYGPELIGALWGVP